MRLIDLGLLSLVLSYPLCVLLPFFWFFDELWGYPPPLLCLPFPVACAASGFGLARRGLSCRGSWLLYMLRVIYARYLVCVVCMDGHGGIMYCGNFVFFYYYACVLVICEGVLPVYICGCLTD